MQIVVSHAALARYCVTRQGGPYLNNPRSRSMGRCAAAECSVQSHYPRHPDVTVTLTRLNVASRSAVQVQDSPSALRRTQLGNACRVLFKKSFVHEVQVW